MDGCDRERQRRSVCSASCVSVMGSESVTPLDRARPKAAHAVRRVRSEEMHAALGATSEK